MALSFGLTRRKNIKKCKNTKKCTIFRVTEILPWENHYRDGDATHPLLKLVLSKRSWVHRLGVRPRSQAKLSRTPALLFTHSVTRGKLTQLSPSCLICRMRTIIGGTSWSSHEHSVGYFSHPVSLYLLSTYYVQSTELCATAAKMKEMQTQSLPWNLRFSFKKGQLSILSYAKAC